MSTQFSVLKRNICEWNCGKCGIDSIPRFFVTLGDRCNEIKTEVEGSKTTAAKISFRVSPRLFLKATQNSRPTQEQFYETPSERSVPDS
jgi:hypothetical protein